MKQKMKNGNASVAMCKWNVKNNKHENSDDDNDEEIETDDDEDQNSLSSNVDLVCKSDDFWDWALT